MLIFSKQNISFLKLQDLLKKLANPISSSWALVASWWLVGVVMTVVGFMGGYHLIWAGMLLLPIFWLLNLFRLALLHEAGSGWQQKVLVLFLVGTWLVHGVGVVLPEVGFDAVWYHLPVLDFFADQGGITFMPELYQSANPLFSDLMFMPGYLLAGEMGAKLTSYLLAVSLMVVVYRLSRHFLDVSYSLLVVLGVSVFQVITWQASSFYVDVAKALWEVSLVWWIVTVPLSNRKFGVVAGMLLGASVGTKAFSILLVPWTVLILMVKVGLRWRQLAVVTAGLVAAVLLTASSYYLYAYIHLGSPVYTVGHHLEKLGEIGGESQSSSYVWQRLITLPRLPWQLVTTRDYLSPLLVLTLPITLCWLYWQRHRKEIWILASFVAVQVAVWWWVPPLSIRYALSGFVVWYGLMVGALANTGHKNIHWQTAVKISLVVVPLLLILPRIAVTIRALPYVLGQQTHQEYITAKLDGVIDAKLCSWHDCD